jgi:phage tail-like protein
MGLLQKTIKIQKPTLAGIQPLKDFEELPLPAYQFSIYIIDHAKPVALFQSCSGLSVKREIETYAEGGLNDFTREMPGRLSYGHITLNTGLSSSTFFWDWMMEGQYEGRARAMDFTLFQRRPDPNGGSTIYPIIKKWSFTRAFPVSWKIPDLNVTDTNSILVESLELSFDYIKLEP